MENDVAKNSNLWRWQDLINGFNAEVALKPTGATELSASAKALNLATEFIQRVVVDSMESPSG